MNEDLLDLISNSNAATHLLEKSGNFVVNDTIGVSLLFAGVFHKKPGNYLLVTPNLYSAQKVTDLLASLIGDENVLLFPFDDMLRNEALESSKEIVSQRLFVLSKALEEGPRIIVTHTTSLIAPLPTVAEYKNNCFTILKGQSYKLNELKERLIKSGYEQVNKIDQTLQFASRGDILDIFPVSSDNPIRIEFFGDEVENISLFTIENQTTFKQLEKAYFEPANDCLFSDQDLEEFKVNLAAQLKKDLSQLSEIGRAHV